MPRSKPPLTRSPLERSALLACILTFSVFFLNMLYGRFATSLGLGGELHLSGVPEFLLLLGSAVLFAIAALAAESRENRTPD